MIVRFRIVLVVIAAASQLQLSSAAYAEPAPAVESKREPSAIWLDAPLLDLQLGQDHLVIPSMAQSTALAGDLYLASHVVIGKVLDPYASSGWKRWLSRGGLVVFDGLTRWLPFFGGWQHEEWHRAVLGNRGIESEDEIYRLQLFSAHTSVSHVSDGDLASLTEMHPAEAVRAYSAGIEANYELATYLEKEEFFRHARIASGTSAFVNYAVNTLYWAQCTALTAADVVQPTAIPDRDFVGPDCTGWAYDLFHPGQPYASRGMDPNGGVQRYQATDAVGPAGVRYLKRQFALSFLNFLDPNIIGINAFTIGNTRWNAHVRHEPTSFGTDTSLEVFLERGDLHLFGAVHTYLDRDNAYRPGLSLELVRIPLARSSFLDPSLTLRTDLWVQPVELDMSSTQTGGRLQARITGRVAHRLEAWTEVEGKTGGWAAGSVALDAALTLRAGFSLSVF